VTAAGPPPRPDSRARLLSSWALLVTASVILIFIFYRFASEVLEGELQTFDETFRRWLSGRRAAGWTRFLGAVTTLGSFVVTLVLSLIAAGWLWIRKGRSLAAAFVLAPTVSTLVFWAIKPIVGRTRPAGGLALASYAFPSGHATAGTGFWVTLMYLLWRERLVPGPAALAGGIVLPFVIGWSRIYLDFHWSSDVAGGWLLGLGLALAAIGVYEFRRVRMIA
jgi:membrane-associated phospholipid phosphatase